MKTINDTSRKFLRAAAAAVILGGVLATGSVFAGDFTGDVPSETVKFQELNLDSPAGVSALYSRIHAAALRVCAAEPRDLSRLGEEKKCAIDSEARAVKQVNRPALTAYYQAKTGRGVATLAAN